MMKRNRKRRGTKKNGSKKKAHLGQSVRYRLWWKRGNIKLALSEDHTSCWVHNDLIVTTKQIQALLIAARASGGKDECQVRLTGVEREHWMGTAIGRLGGYGFRGTVTVSDGSNQTGGGNGSRVCEPAERREEGRIQLEPSGTSGLSTSVEAPHADILLEAIKELRKRTTAGAATFLVKVKAHRGEPASEEADIQADKAISGKDVPMEWHDRTNRAVFTWQDPRRKGGTVRYQDRKLTWNSGVRKAIRRGSAEEEAHKHSGAWKQISKQRQRVDVSYDPSMVRALQHGTWMDEEGFKKTCIR